MSESVVVCKGSRECEATVHQQSHIGGALAETNLGVKERFELPLHQFRLGGAGRVVAAEEARETLRAASVASLRSF